MNIKKEIEFLKYLKKEDIENFREKCCDYEIESEINGIEKQYDDVISLLQQGKAFKDMWIEFQWKHGDEPMGEYIDIATQMNNLKQKHFPKGD